MIPKQTLIKRSHCNCDCNSTQKKQKKPTHLIIEVAGGVASVEVRTTIRKCPLHHLRVAILRRSLHRVNVPREPFARAHWSTARWPLQAARMHVCSVHEQPLTLTHWRTAKWPPPAAPEHVSLAYGQPRAH